MTDNKMTIELICRLLNHKQRVQYAIFAAEQAVEIYERQYSDAKRPRQAIEAAKKWLKTPNKNIAYAAASAAAYAAYAAAVNAASAAAKKKMRTRILEYGIQLLSGRKSR